MEPSACEGELESAHKKDLKAFERRLTEVVLSYRPPTFRWRILLSAMSMCTAIGAWYWLRDPRTTVVPLTESLWIHPIFTAATVTLIVLFILGIQKLVIAPQIITSRTRNVLGDFNMSCDDTGKLILKPRQSNNNST
ncbi:nuclear envelope phosphatase-regulatory subunit 1 homolog isoform X1 [Drosophila subobscura]|uniref:nuclear envelope phosphatase-regulatory subunit 1 homolog isoform X1 n=1 Tax=Drosophila subobscura TaxID=7241 RepID=UPI00155A9AB2|nr:nuclear envelope phosphatase-regulatory subunit 1 homolog isoform X1 [Drosophila subobscura]